jgi:hypothetical protein
VKAVKRKPRIQAPQGQRLITSLPPALHNMSSVYIDQFNNIVADMSDGHIGDLRRYAALAGARAMEEGT